MPSIKNKIVKLALITACTTLFAGHALAGSGEYLSRSDTVTLSAGNAKDSNNAIQAPTPWPRGVNNTRIPGDGERGVIVYKKWQESLKSPTRGSTTINIGVPGLP